MQRLGGLDTAFLYLETPTNHLHVAWAAVLDTRGSSDAAAPGRICELMRARLHLLPALRRRLADPRGTRNRIGSMSTSILPTIARCRRRRNLSEEAVAADVLGPPAPIATDRCGSCISSKGYRRAGQA